MSKVVISKSKVALFKQKKTVNQQFATTFFNSWLYLQSKSA